MESFVNFYLHEVGAFRRPLGLRRRKHLDSFPLLLSLSACMNCKTPSAPSEKTNRSPPGGEGRTPKGPKGGDKIRKRITPRLVKKLG